MYCVHTFPFPCYHEVSQYCCLNSGKLTCTSIKYFGFVFRKVDTFRICFVSRIFFHSLFLVYSQGVLAFYCCENCENPRLVKQLLFITSDKAFMEILLRQKFFPNISSWLFLKKRICIISADLCNPCIIMYEILYITLLWYVLQLLYFHLLCPDF